MERAVGRFQCRPDPRAHCASGFLPYGIVLREWPQASAGVVRSAVSRAEDECERLMAETWLEQLHQWHEFYVLVGTAAATLTGLMFVVVSIGPQIIATRGSSGVRAFVTPVMVHFTSVLVVSALMIVPLMTPGILAVLLALGSLGVLIFIFAIGVHG